MICLASYSQWMTPVGIDLNSSNPVNQLCSLLPTRSAAISKLSEAARDLLATAQFNPEMEMSTALMLQMCIAFWITLFGNPMQTLIHGDNFFYRVSVRKHSVLYLFSCYRQESWPSVLEDADFIIDSDCEMIFLENWKTILYKCPSSFSATPLEKPFTFFLIKVRVNSHNSREYISLS